MAAKDMTEAFQNPHPDIPFTSVRDDTIKALAALAAIFKLKLQQAASFRDPSFACHTRSTIKHHSLINPNLELAHSRQAANWITDENSHSRHP
jgi:hypothetical protein